jgi:hypothetical protein
MKWIKTINRKPDTVECEIVFRSRKGEKMVRYISWDTKIDIHDDDYFEWLDESSPDSQSLITKEKCWEENGFGIGLPSNQSLIDRVKELDKQLSSSNAQQFQQSEVIQLLHQRISELEKERDELKEGLRKIAEHPEESEQKFPLLTIAAFKQIAINLLTN